LDAAASDAFRTPRGDERTPTAEAADDDAASLVGDAITRAGGESGSGGGERTARLALLRKMAGGGDAGAGLSKTSWYGSRVGAADANEGTVERAKDACSDDDWAEARFDNCHDVVRALRRRSLGAEMSVPMGTVTLDGK
jgi:hypothetical protein